ncbi:alpha/beta fold hydrolase [Tateyamaria sp. SN3-11]|uniref:alpha/beta fold hydrolase n=1 Tax=Tateyamaria sp. SN3-11 TaxID=3092147 RepID=UPI0039E8707F
MTESRQNFRQYGKTASHVVLLHGGPGGAGEIEPLAQELGKRGHAVLEPFQAGRSVSAQVDELKSQIDALCSPPVVVVGWSWGAWLGCLFAGRYRDLVSKLILVGSGPFEARFASGIRTTKNSRLTHEQRSELKALRTPDGGIADVARFIELSDVADTYSRDASLSPTVDFDAAIHGAVWPEADEMRQSGALVDKLSAIRCPVLAIHGDYDPRPSEGVRRPLKASLPDAQFIELERCGHKPWQEVHAKREFYRLLESAID